MEPSLLVSRLHCVAFVLRMYLHADRALSQD